MHELTCPSCNAPSQYDLRDYMLMCPFCSVSFRFHMESGKKDIYSEHYIVPNACDSRQIQNIVYEWLRRLHHQIESVDKEYYLTDINGYSVPYWVISLEAHTMWKGLVRKSRNLLDQHAISNSIQETGQFRRNYRWAVSARSNLCENWGMTRLHEPKEPLEVVWDGFPLDSTFSRGRIDMNLGVKTSRENQDDELSAYDAREFFEFKYANGLPILNIQVSDEEALQRTKNHVLEYHCKLARLNVDILINHRTELEVAGIQLVHLPLWYGRYIYQPGGMLRHFHQPKEKNVILDGYAGGVLKGELAIVKRDKLWINTIVCCVASLFMAILGGVWHGAFMLVALFLMVVAIISGYMATRKLSASNRIDQRAFGKQGPAPFAAAEQKEPA